MDLLKINNMNERLQVLRETVKSFKDRAKKYDEEQLFPIENINELKAINYHALTIPKRYGGKEISLLEMVQMQKIIAQADGSTALSIGWHVGIIKGLHDVLTWQEETFKHLCEKVIKDGALINSAASEAATGSPTRGGKPTTTAVRDGEHWIINGRKIFTTMAPMLDYFIVSATIVDSGEVASFIIRKETAGVTIEETWDSIAMRATGSHDLVLENVRVHQSDLVEYITPGEKRAAGWLLHIPACYLGIAKAARDYALDFALHYSPNSISGVISDLPNVRQKIGEIEWRLIQSEHFLYSVAREWDESDPNERQMMKPQLAAVKLSVVNTAIEIVDLAMRMTGAQSLAMSNPLQRYYRDVRAGLHNPPMDDMTIQLLANHALEKIKMDRKK